MNTELIKSTQQLTNLIFSLIDHPDQNIKTHFVSAFQASAPEIATQLITASNDVNCSCRNAIVQYIANNFTSCVNFIVEYANSDSVLEAFILQLNNTLNVMLLSGKIVKTNIDEWQSFSEQINKANTNNYKSFSVLPSGDDLLVFFL